MSPKVKCPDQTEDGMFTCPKNGAYFLHQSLAY